MNVRAAKTLLPFPQIGNSFAVVFLFPCTRRANISNGNQIALNCWKKNPFKNSASLRQLQIRKGRSEKRESWESADAELVRCQ